MKLPSGHFERLASEGVTRITPYPPGKPISELQREYGIDDIIKLASNENPLGPSPKAVEACQQHLAELEIYPDGNGYELKQALAKKHNVEIGCITLGNGSNDILEFVARVFLSPGHNAVFSQHAFAVYPLVTMATGADLHEAGANSADSAMPFGHNLENMRQQVDEQTRVVFIANPNNPTGTWLSAASLRTFIDDLPDHVIVVLDEAYVEYVQEADYPDSLNWLADYSNLIITRTFSKVYGLAGLRIGYSLSHPELAGLMNRVRQPFNTNTLAQAGALAALADDDHLTKSVESNRIGLEQVSAAFQRAGIEYIPSVGNFISFKTELAGSQVYEGLLREGVIIRPISNYGLADYLRVTIGSEDQNARFLKALQTVTGLTL
jgi:histidinol-phosphate aminotransferase